MAESTPFLPNADSNDLDTDSAFPNPPPANPPATDAIARLTNTSFFASLVTLVVLIAAYIACAVSPLYTWSIESDIGYLAFFTALAALLSFLNRTSILSCHNTPLMLNIALDAFLTYSIFFRLLSFAGNARQPLRYPRCGVDYGGPDDGAERGCVGWLIGAGSVVALGLLGTVIVGCAHLNLLVLRCRNLWRSRFWERQFLPAGGVAIEFNVRALRVDGAGDRSARIEGRTEDERLVEV